CWICRWYEIGRGMINVTLLMSTSLSIPAISTPKLKAARIVITIPKRRKAMKIESKVNVVRIFRRHTFIQINGKNFMTRGLPTARPYRGEEYVARVPQRVGRV